jgi:predicted MPP superfamily phosphohydrolase
MGIAGSCLAVHILSLLALCGAYEFDSFGATALDGWNIGPAAAAFYTTHFGEPMTIWRIIMFALIAGLVWGSAHTYVGWSLGRFITRRRLKHLLWGLLATSFVVTLGALIVRRVGPDMAFSAALQWLAYLSIGVFSLLIALVIVRDLVLLLIGTGYKVFGDPSAPAAPAGSDLAESDLAESDLAESDLADPDLPRDPSRRELFRNTVNASLAGVAVAGAGLGYQEARRLAEVREVDVPIEGLAADLDGFRIVQVSDVHVGPTIKRDYLQAVVDTVNTLDADLIAFTGDMVDGFVEDMRDDVSPIREFEARHGAFFVTGNHEYYWDGPAWCDEVERCGMHVLNNAHRVVDVGNARLVVGGVTDYRAGARVEGHASDPHRAIEGAPEADFRLLLAHQPKSVWEAAKAGFDLQLSGHTHGGQFWPWSLFVGLAHPFFRGLNDYEDMKIYVSSGTGYWGPPMRLGVPSEITQLTLRRA